jgi:hypothetical protein
VIRDLGQNIGLEMGLPVRAVRVNEENISFGWQPCHKNRDVQEKGINDVEDKERYEERQSDNQNNSRQNSLLKRSSDPCA